MFPNSRTRTYYIFLNFVCKDNDFSPHYTTFPHFFLILTFENIFRPPCIRNSERYVYGSKRYVYGSERYIHDSKSLIRDSKSAIGSSKSPIGDSKSAIYGSVFAENTIFFAVFSHNPTQIRILFCYSGVCVIL